LQDESEEDETDDEEEESDDNDESDENESDEEESEDEERDEEEGSADDESNDGDKEEDDGAIADTDEEKVSADCDSVQWSDCADSEDEGDDGDDDDNDGDGDTGDDDDNDGDGDDGDDGSASEGSVEDLYEFMSQTHCHTSSPWCNQCGGMSCNHGHYPKSNEADDEDEEEDEHPQCPVMYVLVHSCYLVECALFEVSLISRAKDYQLLLCAGTFVLVVVYLLYSSTSMKGGNVHAERRLFVRLLSY